MKRIHAFEWEDQAWFPRSWRDYGTDYLRFLAVKFGIYKAVVPVLQAGIDSSGQAEWVDCASGGGSALVPLVQELQPANPGLQVTLTDYYPNEKAFAATQAENPGVFRYEPGSVDARKLPDHLRGRFRTLFGAFHHFRPEDARRILQDAVSARSPIAVFEPVGRNAMSWFSMLFVIPNVLLLTPFIRPVRWQVLPFIYLLPLIPLYVLWDGIVSILRTYSEAELRALVHSLEGHETFDWEIGSKKQGPGKVYYLLGRPKQG